MHLFKALNCLQYNKIFKGIQLSLYHNFELAGDSLSANNNEDNKPLILKKTW
jgi:hypothetical protein